MIKNVFSSLILLLSVVVTTANAQTISNTELENRANNGDAEAANILTTRFDNGKNVSIKDTNKAIKYARISAELGDATGASNLSMLLGRSISDGIVFRILREGGEACDWAIVAAKRGVEKHFREAGICTRKINKEESCNWYIKASNHKDKYAHNRAGICSKNESEKVTYFTRAHEAGDEWGSYNLAYNLFSDLTNIERVQKILKPLLTSENADIIELAKQLYAASFLTPSLGFDTQEAFSVFGKSGPTAEDFKKMDYRADVGQYSEQYPKEVAETLIKLAQSGSTRALETLSDCIYENEDDGAENKVKNPFAKTAHFQKKKQQCKAIYPWIPKFNQSYIVDLVIPAIKNSSDFYSSGSEKIVRQGRMYSTIRLLKKHPDSYPYVPALVMEMQSSNFFDKTLGLEEEKKINPDNKEYQETILSNYNYDVLNILRQTSDFLSDSSQLHFPYRNAQQTLAMAEVIFNTPYFENVLDESQKNKIDLAKQDLGAKLFNTYARVIKTSVPSSSLYEFAEKQIPKYLYIIEKFSAFLNYDGHLELAERFRQGIGVKKDLEKAVYHYRNSAKAALLENRSVEETGYSYAMTGALHEHLGNIDSAKSNYQRAVNVGYSRANSALSRLIAQQPKPKKAQWQIILDVMLDDRNIRSAFEEYDMVRNYCSNFNNYQVRDEWANTYRCKRYDACMSLAESLIDKKDDDKDRMCNATSSIKRAIYSAFSGQTTSDIDLAFQEADSSIKGNYQSFKSAFPYLKVDFNKIGRKMEREEAQARSQAAWASLMRKIEDVPNAINRDLASAERVIQQASGVRSALKQPESVRNIEYTASNINSNLRNSKVNSKVNELTKLTLTNTSASTSPKKLSLNELTGDFIEGTGNLKRGDNFYVTPFFFNEEAKQKWCSSSMAELGFTNRALFERAKKDVCGTQAKGTGKSIAK